MKRLALLAMVVLAGCSATGHLPPSPPAPLATTFIPTPRLTSTPKPTPDPAAGLTVGKLTYSTNTCYTDVRDADGHVLHGGVVEFKVTVSNSLATKSVPIWLHVRPDDTLLSSPMGMEGSVGNWLEVEGQSSAFGGTTIPAKGKTNLHWRVFFEAPYVVHYQPSLIYGDPDSDAGVVWDHAFTTINIC